VEKVFAIKGIYRGTVGTLGGDGFEMIELKESKSMVLIPTRDIVDVSQSNVVMPEEYREFLRAMLEEERQRINCLPPTEYKFGVIDRIESMINNLDKITNKEILDLTKLIIENNQTRYTK
jgi:hypothetical protein